MSDTIDKAAFEEFNRAKAKFENAKRDFEAAKAKMPAWYFAGEDSSSESVSGSGRITLTDAQKESIKSTAKSLLKSNKDGIRIGDLYIVVRQSLPSTEFNINHLRNILKDNKSDFKQTGELASARWLVK